MVCLVKCDVHLEYFTDPPVYTHELNMQTTNHLFLVFLFTPHSTCELQL